MSVHTHFARLLHTPSYLRLHRELLLLPDLSPIHRTHKTHRPFQTTGCVELPGNNLLARWMLANAIACTLVCAASPAMMDVIFIVDSDDLSRWLSVRL
jgi:hypothetical protein